jgi:hypothetical protein
MVRCAGRLPEYPEDPNTIKNKAFQEASATDMRSIHIIKEALRLYSPTRRVHQNSDGERCAADIEECQRFNLFAGEEPLVFRPERW